jgi:hypothetical protein
MSGLFPGEEPQGVSDEVLHDTAFQVQRITSLESGQGRVAGEDTVGITFISTDGTMKLTFSYPPDVARELGRRLAELADMIESKN